MFDIIEPTDEQLTSLLLYGLPKTGKSTILANLTINEPNSLVISTDPKGYHFLKARVKQVDDYKESTGFYTGSTLVLQGFYKPVDHDLMNVYRGFAMKYE